MKTRLIITGAVVIAAIVAYLVFGSPKNEGPSQGPATTTTQPSDF